MFGLFLFSHRLSDIYAVHLRILKACTLWRLTTEIRTKKISQPLWNVVMWIAMFLFFVEFLLLGPEVQFNRVFFVRKMVWLLDWSGDERESFDTHRFFVWGCSLHRGSSFCCCQNCRWWELELGRADWRRICGENRTDWRAKLDNSQKRDPKRYTLVG